MVQMQLLPNKITKKLLIRVIALLGILLLPIVILLAFFLQFNGRVYPNIVLAGTNIGGMTPEDARKAVAQSFLLPENIVLNTSGETHVVHTNSIGAQVDYETSVQMAYTHGRSGVLLDDLRTVIHTIRAGSQFDPVVNLDRNLLESQLSAYAESVTTLPVDPEIKIVNNEIVVTRGEPGTEIDINLLQEKIIDQLITANTDPIVVNVTPVDNTITDEQILATKLRAQNLIDKNLQFTFEHQSFNYSPDRFFSFINPNTGYYEKNIAKEVETIAKAINRDPQNPVFTFTDGRVQEFKPAKDGVVVNQEKFIALIVDSLKDLENEDLNEVAYPVPVSSTAPTVSMENVNDLGIKELIGRGTSEFKGSIPSRVYNINLASSRLNGVLIKPGEEFSFNGALGDVSALTGYKQAYVIQGGRTVLGDGGGVCQVSTTFFRSALDAGLPVIERNPHSYRVSYYEQDSGPGLDASIYTPTLDLKIVNDTPGHILIQTIADTENMTLVFELYGTSDGREATISEPIITSQSAPPEPLYIDDPEKPAGYTEQIDYAAWGAKAQFDYKVERNGETLIEKTFFSNYRPWQAKFIRGTGPATPTT